MLKFMDIRSWRVNNKVFTSQLVDERTGAWLGLGAKNDVVVNETTAMQCAAVFACVKVLAETFATTPLKLYIKGSGGAEEAREHPLFSLVHFSPNEEQTAYNYLLSEKVRELILGNSYSLIRRNGINQIVDLIPFATGSLTPKRTKEGVLYYEYQSGLEKKDYAAEQILHIPCLSLDGTVGLSPIKQAQEAIGMAIAAEKFGSNFYKNGANVGGVFTHPGGGASLDEESAKRMREQLNQTYAGIDNAHKFLLLEEGVTYTRIGIPPEEAQFLAARQYQLQEIARMYRVPLHLVGDLERSTNNNIEHQSLEFIQYTMLPHFKNWEQMLNFKLLSKKERAKGYFFEFSVDGWLRGDHVARSQFYHMMRNDGILSTNEIRLRENLNPRPEPEADELLVNGNMISVTTAAKQQPKMTGGGNNEGDANNKSGV